MSNSDTSETHATRLLTSIAAVVKNHFADGSFEGLIFEANQFDLEYGSKVTKYGTHRRNEIFHNAVTGHTAAINVDVTSVILAPVTPVVAAAVSVADMPALSANTKLDAFTTAELQEEYEFRLGIYNESLVLFERSKQEASSRNVEPINDAVVQAIFGRCTAAYHAVMEVIAEMRQNKDHLQTSHASADDVDMADRNVKKAEQDFSRSEKPDLVRSSKLARGNSTRGRPTAGGGPGT